MREETPPFAPGLPDWSAPQRKAELGVFSRLKESRPFSHRPLGVLIVFFFLGQERKGVKTKSIAPLGIMSLAPRPPFFSLKTQGSGGEFDRRQMFWGRIVSSAGTERLHVDQCPFTPSFSLFFFLAPLHPSHPPTPLTPRRRRCGVTGARKWPENLVGRSHTSEGGGRGRRGRRLEGGE